MFCTATLGGQIIKIIQNKTKLFILQIICDEWTF